MSPPDDLLARCPKFLSVAVQMDDDQDGVVLAAALALKRMLAEHGLNWRTILPSLFPGAKTDREITISGWSLLVAQCWEQRKLLNEWEQSFLCGLQRLSKITAKRGQRLADIALKLGIDGGAA
jgi:hypothetical protein